MTITGGRYPLDKIILEEDYKDTKKFLRSIRKRPDEHLQV